MKYLCLAYGDEKDWNVLTKKEQDEMLAQDEVLRKRGALVAAVQTTTTTVRAWDGNPITTDGAFADSTAHPDGAWALHARSAGRLSYVLYLHRPRRRGVYTLHFPASQAGRTANGRRISSGRRRAGSTHAEPAQFLGAGNRALLLSRHVHGNSAHDPRRVRHLQLSSRSA